MTSADCSSWKSTRGYVAAEVVDRLAHVSQVSVDPQLAGRGIGRRLMEQVEAWGRDHGCAATTLTTFGDVPWNAPCHVRLGYRVLADDEIGLELSTTLSRERRLPGLDITPRCAMRKDHRNGGAGRANVTEI